MCRRSLSVLQPLKDKISSQSMRLDRDLQEQLERLSLLSFQSQRTLTKVQQTIEFSNIIQQVNVEHLTPLYTLVENEMCPLRQADDVSNGTTLNCQQVLSNASTTYEDYVVAPMMGKRDSQTVEKVDQTSL
jgi:Asp-tRNA(Asn)/Glu-tRNA(Gln) amidotransferase C subunit